MLSTIFTLFSEHNPFLNNADLRNACVVRLRTSDRKRAKKYHPFASSVPVSRKCIHWPSVFPSQSNIACLFCPDRVSALVGNASGSKMLALNRGCDIASAALRRFSGGYTRKRESRSKGVGWIMVSVQEAPTSLESSCVAADGR